MRRKGKSRGWYSQAVAVPQPEHHTHGPRDELNMSHEADELAEAINGHLGTGWILLVVEEVEAF